MFGLPNPMLYIGLGLVLACGTFFGLWRWDAHDLSLANGKLADAVERANTNFQAAQQCAAQVEQDKASIALQNDANEKLRASFNDMERAAVNLETEKARLLQTLEDRTAEVEAEAKAHPDQVVPVGAIVRARVPHLWDDARSLSRPSS